MKEYKIRIYRDNFNRDRWQTFTISYKESDLCMASTLHRTSPK